jgi:UDP-N-acetylmuramate--alanine ligase
MNHKIKHIHFIGIGGVGMSGIAEVLLHLGYHVSGTDVFESSAIKRLRRAGAFVAIGHDAAHVEIADVVVTSTAIRADNPEILTAQAKSIPVIPRAMMLAELMRFRQGIAIAGTHGKTTTTSLVASILEQGGLDPTYVIGGKLTAAGANAYLGKGEYLVAEADESDASFLLLSPMLAVITNIDEDHMETYDHNVDRLRQAFVDFLHRLPFYGRAVLCDEDPNIRRILPSINRPVWLYGFSEHCHLRASHIVARDDASMDFFVQISGETPFKIHLNLPGYHNVLNALAAIGIALELGVSIESIQQALKEFKGVGRRFQRYGDILLPAGGKFTLVDDYGHHPVEMKATLEAARGAFASRRLVLVFQPHRYSRTRDLFREFVHILASVDVLILTQIYSAGETEISEANAETLVQAIKAYAPSLNVIYQPHFDQLIPTVLGVAQASDVVLTMGAGSIGQLPGQICTYQETDRLVV